MSRFLLLPIPLLRATILTSDSSSPGGKEWLNAPSSWEQTFMDRRQWQTLTVIITDLLIYFFKNTAEQQIVKRLKTKILKFPFCSWSTIDVADSQHGLARCLHQVTWPVSTNWNASSPDSQSWKAMSRIAGDSPRFPGNPTTPGSSHRPCCSPTTLVCFCFGFPGWAGLCLFCQHLSLLTTF